jgi:hypothetical protein
MKERQQRVKKPFIFPGSSTLQGNRVPWSFIRSFPQFVIVVFLPLLFLLWLPGGAYAQGPADQVNNIEWQELKTEKFTIVYAEEVLAFNLPIECRCGVTEAEYYATFIDEIYDDLAIVFGVQLVTPINLRLFPTEESYYQVNPIAKRLPGGIAHALNTRDEIAIALPRTDLLTEEELINNMRHEMTHLFASQLSDGNLTAGFQEGIAQYLEKPTDKANYEPTLLEQAVEQNRLLTWAELDQSEAVYSDPQVAYPQSISIVAFLIDRYGLANFTEFLRVVAQEPGYRSALEAAYGKSADDLEAEWLAYLPEYFAGRWQVNAIYTYDLSRVRQLVANAAYTAAVTELSEIVALLESTEQFETLAEAESLLAQAHQGQTAGALAAEARESLLQGNYQMTIAKGNEALAAYEALNYRERVPEIQNYIYRAELGQQALSQLSRGEQMLQSLRFLEAERELHEATALLQTLGDQTAAQQGETLLTESAWQQRLLIYALIGVASLMLFFNTLRRIFNRFIAGPLEVEFT